MSKIERHIFEITNRERRKHRLNQLAWSRSIGRIARNHSRDMARRKYYSHKTLGSLDEPTDRADKAGLDMGIGENIAYTWTDTHFTISKGVKHHARSKNERSLASELVKMWMKSAGHRFNILGNYNQIGVGVWINYKNGKVYATQDFAFKIKAKNRVYSIAKSIAISIAGSIAIYVVLGILLGAIILFFDLLSIIQLE